MSSDAAPQPAQRSDPRGAYHGHPDRSSSGLKKFELALKLSEHVIAGLAEGNLIRRGSAIVIREGMKGAGEVAAFVRETGIVPSLAPVVAPSIAVVAPQMAILSGVASLVNLGATIYFGRTTLQKLSQIDDRIMGVQRHLDRRFDRIEKAMREGNKRILNELSYTQDVVEFGFASALRMLEKGLVYQEIRIIAALNSAIKGAWDVQTLEPENSDRRHQLNNALTQARSATEEILMHVQDEIEQSVDRLMSKSGNQRVKIEKEPLQALRRLRVACFACDATARIQAEINPLDATADNLAESVSRLNTLIRRLGSAFFRRAEPNHVSKDPIYDRLLHPRCDIPGLFPRMDLWLRLFDPDIHDSSQLLREFRKRGVFTKEGTSKLSTRAWRLNTEPLSEFLNLLEGSAEDIDRLDGHVLEYRDATRSGLKIGEHRKRLSVTALPKEGELVFFLPVEGPKPRRRRQAALA